MKPLFKTTVILGSLLLALIIPITIFLLRSPVLIVTDIAFVGLYGQERIRKEAMLSSIILFRPVLTVEIADDAGDDIVQFAVAETSSKPFCVLFPLRYARAARLYRERNPQIPVVLLEGRYTEEHNPAISAAGGNLEDYFIYKSDINADFFNAALAAAAIDMGKNGKIVMIVDNLYQRQAREAALLALNRLESPLDLSVYTALSQYNADSGVSCVILAGIGAEYFEQHTGVPVIFFTWITPQLLPDDVVIAINDSPWAQTADAVRMVGANSASGLIQSKFRFLNPKIINNKSLRKMQKQR
jgi:hypothetical protein